MKKNIQYLRIVSLLIVVSLLSTGIGIAQRDNYTVLDRFPDGSVEHIIQYHIFESPHRDPFWTCPKDQLQPPGAPSAAPDDNMAPSPPCYIPRPKITHERIEMWLNQYGQVIKLRYLDKYLARDREIIQKMPENETEAISDTNWQSYYIDTDGAVVSYYDKRVVPSNKSIESPVKYPPGYNAVQAMKDLNLTKRQFMRLKNHMKIKEEAYNHSNEAQELRLKELSDKLKQKNAELNALNKSVTWQSGIINRILDWVLKTFGIDLR